jgi:crotonobetainyl-CoA:carnitine CoA-transferase CaiB-like acyl-CoA transferase
MPACTLVTTTVRTADGWIAVSPTSRAHVQATCEAAGHPEWLEELEPHMRFGELGPQLVRRLESVSRSKTSDAWLALFLARDVPVAPVLDVDGHLNEPQVRHNGIYAEIEHPVAGRVRYARWPAKLRRSDGGTTRPERMRPMPATGEHQEEILRDLEAGSRPSEGPARPSLAV